MSDNMTVARPYAKAIFQMALSQQQISSWSCILQTFAEAIEQPMMTRFILNPSVALASQIQLFLSLVDSTALVSLSKVIESMIRLLAENKRLLLLPTIYAEFERLREDYEKTLVVYVTTFLPLTGQQEDQLVKRLSHRLQRTVTLEVNVDRALLGGAVIRAGDLMIDDSVRSKLIKLEKSLAA